ncbi:ClpP/crotonase [Lepidopterella palustris CBS 459.81]|uniref:ClpP/crotonase n=1 Tax=Lepidopterella palustris CBS 459.81 TaxID=1314670 RepID=A0A8E2E2L4_9PEZI|nr:ClpP/crotonase [Lepidopterella palustris CBS 459.81]
MAKLFSLPISTGGTFECSSLASQIYLLSFSSPPDNRLTTAFINAFSLALDILQEKYPAGVLITTSSIPKFYSNGLDLPHFRDTVGFSEKTWFPFYQKLLTYHMPTIALINGHAFAGGLILAEFHDYRVQNPSRGFLCLNEIHIGMVIPPPLVAIFREKVSPNVFRTMVLEGKRFTAQEALKEGLIDALGGIEEAAGLVKSKALLEKVKTGIWGSMKEEMYRETLGMLRGFAEGERWRKEIENEKNEKAKTSVQEVAKWERGRKLKL